MIADPPSKKKSAATINSQNTDTVPRKLSCRRPAATIMAALPKPWSAPAARRPISSESPEKTKRPTNPAKLTKMKRYEASALLEMMLVKERDPGGGGALVSVWDKFAVDSPLEEAGFELLVPLATEAISERPDREICSEGLGFWVA